MTTAPHDSRRNQYTDTAAIADLASDGRHRQAVGGLWDEIGQLQFDFLLNNGLKPEHYLLDLGCGSFRCGVKLVPYLDPGHYYGLDLNASLIDAGYDKEIVPAGLANRLPRANLASNDRFDASGFARPFDYAIALSLFTHLPWNDIRVCLEMLADVMAPGAKLFATYFPLAAAARSGVPVRHEPGGIVTYGNRDPYHYRPTDIEHACSGLPWRLIWHGGWGHPRAQHMACLRA